MLIAAELRDVGIDANCAPVADIAGPLHPSVPAQPLLWRRMPERCADVARAVADAHLAMGVLPVVKHMPGHGRVGE